MFSLARDNDSICAVSTANGFGAIAVVRLSGDKSVDICRKLADFLPENPESHRVYYGFLKEFVNQQNIDEVLATYFAEGRSFTGEKTIEISCHGSPVVSQLILQNLISAGARLAEPGEFTYRAFVNGRIDLTQAESILMMVESESKLSANMALRQLRGELSVKFREIRDGLIWALSRLEANIDFSSEDIEFEERTVILTKIKNIADLVQSLMGTFQVGRIIRGGIRAVLIGQPNVGKSSLLNALLNENRSIVSAIAGTTRDVVESYIEIEGKKIELVDTAGLHNTNHPIELLGIEKTLQEIEKSDVIIHVQDAQNYDLYQIEMFKEKYTINKPIISVVNKIDLLSTEKFVDNVIPCSAHHFLGINDILHKIIQLFSIQQAGSLPVMVTRQYETLSKISNFLNLAVNKMKENISDEFVIAELNEALYLSFALLGEKVDDQILDQVFKDFCLGK